MNYCGAYGAHINNITGGIFEKLVRWAPPVVVSLEHHPEWAWVIDALKGRTFFIGRVYQEREPDFDNDEFDVKQMARDHVALCLRQGIRYDAYQGFNERAIDTEDGMKRYAEFDAERSRLLAGHGLRACIGNFSSGAPGQLSLWEFYLDAFKAGAQYGAVFGHHGYGWPKPYDGGRWHPFRIEIIYEGEESHGWQGVPEEYWLPAFYTEAGSDKGVRPGYEGQLGGWRDAYDNNPQEYMDDLDVASKRILSKPYMMGAAHYCFKSVDAQWYGYDGWPDLMEAMARQAQPVYRKPHYSAQPSFGADVSEWQGANFPWKQLVSTGADFAFIRATVGTKTDRHFHKNAERALASGLLVGHYHYLMPNSNPEQQALHFWEQQAPHLYDLPPVVDFEQSGLSGEWLQRWLVRYKELSNTRPMIYSNWNSIHRMVGWNRRWLSRYKLWVAHWYQQKPMLPTPWKQYEFHQYTNKGNVPGHKGRVDLNRFKSSGQALFNTYG